MTDYRKTAKIEKIELDFDEVGYLLTDGTNDCIVSCEKILRAIITTRNHRLVGTVPIVVDGITYRLSFKDIIEQFNN